MARRAEPVRPQKAPRRLIGPGSVTPEPVGSGKGALRQEPRQERVAAFRLGLSAESRAAMLLVAKAYRIVARRFRAPGGEIDIVARRRRDLVFVEVKARDDLDAAAEAVTERGKRRIVAAAEYWLASHPQDADCFIRFDVILVAPGKLPRHIVNAFDATP
jgi:putative endonuclease